MNLLKSFSFTLPLIPSNVPYSATNPNTEAELRYIIAVPATAILIPDSHTVVIRSQNGTTVIYLGLLQKYIAGVKLGTDSVTYQSADNDVSVELTRVDIALGGVTETHESPAQAYCREIAEKELKDAEENEYYIQTATNLIKSVRASGYSYMDFSYTLNVKTTNLLGSHILNTDGKFLLDGTSLPTFILLLNKAEGLIDDNDAVGANAILNHMGMIGGYDWVTNATCVENKLIEKYTGFRYSVFERDSFGPVTAGFEYKGFSIFA